MAKQIVPIQMYAATASDSAANIDVPADGEIVGVLLEVTAQTLDADGDAAGGEVSFGSSSQFTTNDARNALATCNIRGSNVSANVGVMSSQRVYVEFGGDGVPVSAGERIHLHTRVAGGASSPVVRAILYFKFAGTLRVRRR